MENALKENQSLEYEIPNDPMIVSRKFKILSGSSCLSSEKRRIPIEGKNRSEWPISFQDRAHGHYWDIVKELLESNQKNISEKLSEIYTDRNNYGKQVTINIQCSIDVL